MIRHLSKSNRLLTRKGIHTNLANPKPVSNTILPLNKENIIKWPEPIRVVFSLIKSACPFWRLDRRGKWLVTPAMLFDLGHLTMCQRVEELVRIWVPGWIVGIVGERCLRKRYEILLYFDYAFCELGIDLYDSCNRCCIVERGQKTCLMPTLIV